MAVKFLDNTGLGYFWSKIKVWCNATFAAITHNHASNAVNAMTGYSKPSSGSAIAASDTLNAAVGKLEAKIDAYDDSNYVHKTGAEEISGYKTYTSSLDYDVEDVRQHLKVTELNISNPNITLGTDSTDFTAYSQIILTGSTQNSDSDRLGYWFYHHPSTAQPDAYMRLGLNIKNSNLQIVGDQLTIGYDGTNEVFYAMVPATSSLRTSGYDIVTRNWIPQDTRIVHTTGNESIAGAKIFNNGITINTTATDLESELKFKNNNLTKGTVPSSNFEDVVLRGIDKDNKYLYGLYHRWYTDGSATFRLMCYNHGVTNTVGSWVSLACGYDKDGIAFGTAPSTSTSRSNGTDIVTRDFIPNDTRIVHTTGSEAIEGSKTFYAGASAPSVEFYRHATLTKGEYLAAFRVAFDENISGTVSKLTDHPIHVIAGGGTASGGIRLGSIHGPTFITSGEIGNNLTKLPGWSDVVTWEDIRLYSDSNIYLFTQCDQDTGNWGSEYLFTNTSLERRVFTQIVPNAPTTTHYFGTRLADKNGTVYSGVSNAVYKTSGVTGAYLYAYNRFTASSTESRAVGIFKETDRYDFRPDAADVNLGYTSTKRWKQLYATTTTISTSDARQKDEIANIPEEILLLWENVNWCQFKFKNAVKEKGSDKARIHTGAVAQQILEAFESKNLSPEQYGFFCYDEWDAEEEEYDEEGNLIKRAVEAGNEYSIRYEEALCIEAAYQRRKNKILENRISELEKQVSDMLQILQSLKGAN